MGVFEVESLNFILYIRTMPRAKVWRWLLLLPHSTEDAASSMNQTPTQHQNPHKRKLVQDDYQAHISRQCVLCDQLKCKNSLHWGVLQRGLSSQCFKKGRSIKLMIMHCHDDLIVNYKLLKCTLMIYIKPYFFLYR